MRLGLIGLQIDRGFGERLHGVGEESGRHQGDPRLVHLDLDREPRRDLQVRRGQRERPPVAGLEEDAGERRDARPVETPRWTVWSASERASRSHRNFMWTYLLKLLGPS
jgi:hypothetical protein